MIYYTRHINCINRSAILARRFPVVINDVTVINRTSIKKNDKLKKEKSSWTKVRKMTTILRRRPG